MFSIARYTGDNDEEKDTRSLEKKQERLNKLNARIANKKRKDSDNQQQQDNNDAVAAPVEKKRKSNTTVVEEKKVAKTVENVEKKKAPTAEKKKQKTAKRIVEEEEPVVEEEEQDAMDVDVAEEEEEQEIEEKEKEEEEAAEAAEEEEELEQEPTEETEVPTLEAFPDMLGPKAKHSKEDVKLLRSMGIPEWMLQPTVVSPKDSCGLDNAGLSEHLVQRCQDLGLSSLFAGSVKTHTAVILFQGVTDRIFSISSNGSNSCIFKKTSFI